MALRSRREEFDQEVLESDIPVLVDFYADWCGPCKMMAPIIDKLSEEFAGRVKIGKRCDPSGQSGRADRRIDSSFFMIHLDTV